MSTRDPRLPAHLPPATTVARCPLCDVWTYEFTHTPGAGVLVEAAVIAHFEECPTVPRVREVPVRRRVYFFVEALASVPAIRRVCEWILRLLTRGVR